MDVDKTLQSRSAALAQIDRSLDEASATMGGGALSTLRRVILPLLRPAIVAALAYSFVHAMTAVSAVIFLVSARHNLATVYIVGRVEAGEIAHADRHMVKHRAFSPSTMLDSNRVDGSN